MANNREIGRQNHNVIVPERSLRELYLPACRLALEEGGAWSIMTCNNQINGEWGSASKRLLTDIEMPVQNQFNLGGDPGRRGGGRNHHGGH